MSDDLSNKIRQIAELLSQDGMAENLKGLISSLTTSPNREETQPQPQDQLPAPIPERNEKSEAEDSNDLMRRVKKVMNSLNTKDDPRINLLTAIHPFLNSKRQKKLTNCIRILQMSRLGSLMDDKK